MSIHRLALASALLWLAGCASAAAPQVNAPAPGKAPIQVAEVVVSPFSDAEIEAQFERARSLLLAEKYKEAAEIFERLGRLAPNGEVAPPSLLNSGVAHEGLGERAAAVERYQRLLQRFPDHPTSRSALFRLVRLYGYLERWSDLVALSEKMRARTDLSVLEAIEVHGAKALGLVEQDRVDEAAREVSLARNLIEDNRLGESGKPPIELAQVSFALGEVRRKKSEKIGFDPMPANFAEVLEQRCQGLLDAQNAYADAMRAYDAHWSAMAGYRVGQLYQQLHRDLMRVPAPVKADTLKKKQLFEGAMRLRYRVLLEKGLKMMDGTVRMGQRTGEDSIWVQRARAAKRDIELALDDEKAAMSKLPFSEEEVEAALELLKKR